jgi:hypothetical protein
VKNNPLNDALSCRAAAREMEEELGIMAHGRLTSGLLRSLQRCQDPACLGVSRSAVIDEAMIRIEGDMILSLLN